MTNREWLSRAFKIDSYIRTLQLAYMNVAADITDKKEIENRRAETLVKIQSMIDEKILIKNEITTAISQLENNFYKTILLERYINCKPIAMIAYEQYYSERALQRLMRKAESKIEQVVI